MGLTCILGTAWGDESKGKNTDVRAASSDMVNRYCGANNAGHGMVYKGQYYMTTIVPSGVLHSHVKLGIGAGVATDPEILLNEIKFFQKILDRDIDLIIDPRAPLVLPYHRQRDRANERKRLRARGNVQDTAGSVGFGAGYCQIDRVARLGARVIDLLYPQQLEERIRRTYAEAEPILRCLYGEQLEITIEEVITKYIDLGQQLRPYIQDVSVATTNCLKRKGEVLCESSQGALLDLLYGTWPFTTGTSLGPGMVFTGLGIPVQPMYVIGVVKAFNSRAGFGPFPTKFPERDEGIRKYIVTRGNQVERFPGVPERDLDVGWLDLPALRCVCSGVYKPDVLALSHIDTLAGLQTVMLADKYEYPDGSVVKIPDFMQPDPFKILKPHYICLEGWPEISNIRRWEDLHDNAKRFCATIEEAAGVQLKYVSFSAERGDIIERR